MTSDERTGARRNVLCVVGARPNFMQIAPLLRAIRARGGRVADNPVRRLRQAAAEAAA